MVDPITPAQVKKQKVWEEMVTKVCPVVTSRAEPRLFAHACAPIYLVMTCAVCAGAAVHYVGG